MDKSKKRIIMVAMVLTLLMVGTAIYAAAVKWVLFLVAGYIALNPGSAACEVAYEPWRLYPNFPYHAAHDHSHFGISVTCPPLAVGTGYYEGRIAARGTLQIGGGVTGKVRGYFRGMMAYAESGIISSSGRITVWHINGRLEVFRM